MQAERSLFVGHPMPIAATKPDSRSYFFRRKEDKVAGIQIEEIFQRLPAAI
jgi:hypothetical protein